MSQASVLVQAPGVTTGGPGHTYRVASVPTLHPYIRNIADDRVTPADEPLVAPDGQWRAPHVFNAGWILNNAEKFDLFHLHFGFECFSSVEVCEVIAALRKARRPLIYTVHDLVNPQLVDQRHHREHLDLLIPAATELITLTAGAARQIRERWGRDATVIAHPSIVHGEPVSSNSTARAIPTVGVELKDLRPNVDAIGILTELAAALQILADDGLPAIARVGLNHRVRSESLRARIRQICSATDRLELWEHPRLTDEQLHSAVTDLDVAVLPYAFGTHSGWLEMCWDLGVPVAVPAIGHWSQQHPDPHFCAEFRPSTDGRALAGALRALLPGEGESLQDRREDRPHLRSERRARRRLELALTVDEHHRIYQRAIRASARTSDGLQ